MSTSHRSDIPVKHAAKLRESIMATVQSSGQPISKIEIAAHVGHKLQPFVQAMLTRLVDAGELVAERKRARNLTVMHYKMPPSAAGLLSVPWLAPRSPDQLRVTGMHHHHESHASHAREIGMPATHARHSPLSSIFAV